MGDTLTRPREILTTALELARQGRDEEAIEVLESALRDDSLKGDLKWLSRLARNAGIISENLGDTERAYDYFYEAHTLAPDDASMLWALGDLCLRMKDRVKAREFFKMCYQAASVRSDRDLLEMLESRAEFWK
jgi:tetratricopeptide (TPR) repeat protein